MKDKKGIKVAIAIAVIGVSSLLMQAPKDSSSLRLSNIKADRYTVISKPLLARGSWFCEAVN
jgi:hypothetical protein